MKNKAPTALVILDGFGYSQKTQYNAIAQAHTPHFDELLETYPATLLQASGLYVGLPEGHKGNSEVGHLTIGSGSVILQSQTMLNLAIKDKTFFTNSILIANLQQLKESDGTLHLMGLLSSGGTHSHINHLFALLKTAQQQGITKVVVHPFLDGRDVPPHSAFNYLKELETKMEQLGIGKIGSLMGRFYAMDRNNNWHFIEQAYSFLTEQQTEVTKTWQEALEEISQEDITDEFLPPVQLYPEAFIKPNDGVIFFNFRADRARQLTSCFTQTPNPIATEQVPLLFFISPVSYGPEYKTTALYQKARVQQTLSNMLHQEGYTLFSVAETEKYAHVTYFFNGGREKILPNEKRVLVPSLIGKEYSKHPEMSADTITEVILTSLKNNPRDFYVVNYANADMVGHTGNFEATVKAIECLDKQLGILYKELVEQRNGTLYITADHGNAETMFNEEVGQPHTSHTANPVPFIMAEQSLKNSDEELPLEELSDIAPFIVHNIQQT